MKLSQDNFDEFCTNNPYTYTLAQSICNKMNQDKEEKYEFDILTTIAILNLIWQIYKLVSACYAKEETQLKKIQSPGPLHRGLFRRRLNKEVKHLSKNLKFRDELQLAFNAVSLELDLPTYSQITQEIKKEEKTE